MGNAALSGNFPLHLSQHLAQPVQRLPAENTEDQPEATGGHERKRCVRVLSKYKVQQQHIAHRAAGNGEQNLPFPEVQSAGHQNGDQLRESVTAGDDADIPQAIEPPASRKPQPADISLYIVSLPAFFGFPGKSKTAENGSASFQGYTSLL